MQKHPPSDANLHRTLRFIRIGGGLLLLVAVAVGLNLCGLATLMGLDATTRLFFAVPVFCAALFEIMLLPVILRSAHRKHNAKR